jgi:transposase InsO family protein
LAAAHEISHRLIRPGHPATNGMVERFKRYAWLYNHHINQKALGHQPPIGAMKEWHRERPELFQKKPVNRPGPDI